MRGDGRDEQGGQWRTTGWLGSNMSSMRQSFGSSRGHGGQTVVMSPVANPGTYLHPAYHAQNAWRQQQGEQILGAPPHHGGGYLANNQMEYQTPFISLHGQSSHGSLDQTRSLSPFFEYCARQSFPQLQSYSDVRRYENPQQPLPAVLSSPPSSVPMTPDTGGDAPGRYWHFHGNGENGAGGLPPEFASESMYKLPGPMADPGYAGSMFFPPVLPDDPWVLDVPSDSLTNLPLQSKGSRNRYLRQVFFIVLLQMALISSVTMLCLYVRSIHAPISSIWWLWIPLGAAWIVSLLVLRLGRDVYPLNVALLVVFTCLLALFIAFVCTTYKDGGYGSAGAWAFVQVFIAALTYTIYCWTVQISFDFLKAFFFSLLCTMLPVAILLTLLSKSNGQLFSWVWFGIHCVITSVLLAMLLYNTFETISKHTADQFLEGTISIYVEFISVLLFGIGAACSP